MLIVCHQPSASYLLAKELTDFLKVGFDLIEDGLTV
jgi:hypothetical protein